jgi:hypothetical protein
MNLVERVARSSGTFDFRSSAVRMALVAKQQKEQLASQGNQLRLHAVERNVRATC